jgi:predicted nucleic acid-binding protein
VLWLADTSVAVPALLASHLAHVQVQDQLAGRVLGLTAHAALETYSVLTRLPGDARLSLDDASTLIAERFDSIIAFEPDQAGILIRTLSHRGIGGGAVYDALIGLAAQQAGGTLLTRDSRARATYLAIGVAHEVLS